MIDFVACGSEGLFSRTTAGLCGTAGLLADTFTCIVTEWSYRTAGLVADQTVSEWAAETVGQIFIYM